MKLPLVLLAAGSLAAVVLWSALVALAVVLVAGTFRALDALTATPLTVRTTAHR